MMFKKVKIIFVFLSFNFLRADLKVLLNQVKESCKILQIEFKKEEYKIAKQNLKKMLQIVSRQEKDRFNLKLRQKQANLEIEDKVKEKRPSKIPLVSFIIPCYNRDSVIEEVIESIYKQNLTIPFEVIAVDDASTDNTFNILLEYEKKLDNFFVYKHAVNKRAPAARNTAILHARGKFIINADSDDLFEEGSLSPMIQFCIDNDSDLCFFQHLKFFIDSNVKRLNTVSTYDVDGYLDLIKILTKNPITISAGNRIFKKNCWLNVGGYLEEVGHDSWSFSFRLFARGYKGKIYPESGYLHRQWTNKSNMYNMDNKNKVNDISPKMVVFENNFLFKARSFNRFWSHKLVDGRFLSHFHSKKLEFIDMDILENLFKAYSCEDKNDFINAYYFYNEICKSYVVTQNILLKTAYIALKVNKFSEALNLLGVVSL